MSRFKVSKSELKSLSYEKFNMLEKNIDNKVYKEIKSPKTSNVMQFDCNKININIYEYNNHQVLTNKIKCSESNINKSTGPKRESEKNLIKLGYNRNIEEKIKPTINMSTILAGNLLLNNFNDCCITNMTDIQVKMNHPKLFSSKLTNFYSRILPEVRVANFVQNMETEIRPLKIILNNIIKKCIESNFYTLLKCRSSVTKNTTKDCYTHSCDVEKYKTNRVVYSIVFHE
ncbi:unnamed protein product [Euphydryas editha]|uniref:Uncharacterized protein n=1 Tax=Euphydryas editha TaxID=104508 RepID=A0AAU9V9N4_EUPED|nr:unnamed protein product [Euphydryas editha]